MNYAVQLELWGDAGRECEIDPIVRAWAVRGALRYLRTRERVSCLVGESFDPCHVELVIQDVTAKRFADLVRGVREALLEGGVRSTVRRARKLGVDDGTKPYDTAFFDCVNVHRAAG